jgi:hypothetical protein
MGAKLSDVYKEQIDRYIYEYENLSFFDNFNEKFQEIIDKTIVNNTHITPIDKYVQCHVCHQSCKDIRVHDRDNVEPYEKMFNNINTSISFEQIIGSEIWNWKAVEKTSVYLSIWNAQDKWNQLSYFISQFQQPIEILIKPSRCWTSLINRYEQNQSELIELPRLLSQTTLISYLPDSNEIENLKTIFDQYDREEQRSIFSKLQTNDQRIQSGNYYLVDKSIKNKYINHDDFSYPIIDPPLEIYSEHCLDCQKSFSFFNRHHHCRMCGQQYCADCLVYKRIPHLGFIKKPVLICQKCSSEKEHFIFEYLFTFVKHLIQSNRLEYLNIYLALLYQYRTDEIRFFYQQTGENYFQIGQFLLALQCFTYARFDSDEWFKYSIKFYEKNQYSFSFTCMKLCNKSETFWIEQANLQSTPPSLALLFYERVKLSIEQLFKIASRKSSENFDICLLYLLYLNLKYTNQINWKHFGEQILLKTKYDGCLAMFCFHLHGKISKDQWYQLAEELSQINQFERLIYLLTYLYHIHQIDFRISKNIYIYFSTKILRSNEKIIELDDWLNDICDNSFDIHRIVVGLSFVHVYKYSSWIEYKQQYIQRKEYFKTLISHKMSEYLYENNDKQWFINGIEDFDPIAYELFNGTNRSFHLKQLGDQYFNDKKFFIALNCYLFCEQSQIDGILLQQARNPMLSLSNSLLYYTVVYKRTRKNDLKILSMANSIVCNDTFYNICVVLSKQNNLLLLDWLKFVIKMYEDDNRFKNIHLFKYHLLILNELEKSNDENDRLINGGLHILFNFDNISSESKENLILLNQPLLTKLNTKVLNELKLSTYKSCHECMNILINPNNSFLAQLKQLLVECLGNLKIFEVQSQDYRAKMYFIQAIILKYENNVVQSINAVHNALLSHPFDSVMFGALMFLDHSNLHSTIRQLLINNIRNNSLNLMDINPPTEIKNYNFLQRTERLMVTKKYERAIIKRLADKNPLEAAYSYLDLIMCVQGNASLYPMSSIMACIYFYKAMTNPDCKSAELYAYRSIIFDLSIEIFLFTRHYLPIYVQIYIYKLLFTIIGRSSDLFAKRIAGLGRQQRLGDRLIIGNSHELILEELLKNILLISKVNPLIHLSSTSTIYDMIYIECAANEILGRYLQFKSRQNSMYQYFYFEGVWKGWIDNKQFVDVRQKCMEDLLDDNNWTMDHVENTLCWPLIPKTDDGWLLNTKHRLQLGHTAYSQVIGVTLNNENGHIEFMFTQAKKNEHNLFDATDVIDVLTNGIVYTIFTLDPPTADYHSHPFHEMRYIPKRLSQIPNFLLTLFQADYLLKMISTGVEICSLQPFEMRSSTENLMQRLPAYIREELQAIAVKKSGLIKDSIHRFWIQPQSTIEYEQTFYKGFLWRTNENITQFYLSDNLKMCVKQHRMKYDEQGNLIDDEDENTDEESAEAQFARTFTKYYDEIGIYFPELLRLKELLKLTFLSRIIQGRYESQREFVSRFEADTIIDQFLREKKQQIGQYIGISNESDEKIYNAFCKNLSKEFFCKKSDLKPYIINWLKYNNERALVQYLKQSFIQEKAKLKFTIDKLEFYHDDENDDDTTMSNDVSKCSWVPAAFSSDSNIKIYGGISGIVTTEQKSGIKEMQEKTKSIVRLDANKMIIDKEKQKSKQKHDERNTQKGKFRKQIDLEFVYETFQENQIKVVKIHHQMVLKRDQQQILKLKVKLVEKLWNRMVYLRMPNHGVPERYQIEIQTLKNN